MKKTKKPTYAETIRNLNSILSHMNFHLKEIKNFIGGTESDVMFLTRLVEDIKKPLIEHGKTQVISTDINKRFDDILTYVCNNHEDIRSRLEYSSDKLERNTKMLEKIATIVYQTPNPRSLKVQPRKRPLSSRSVQQQE